MSTPPKKSSRKKSRNQIRFYNEVLQNKTGLTKDGLTTLKFKKISETNDGNYKDKT